MTIRNWIIGHYIVEYEQGGSDRAEYGTNLLKNLEDQISQSGICAFRDGQSIIRIDLYASFADQRTID
jgi:hypothetical protein